MVYNFASSMLKNYYAILRVSRGATQEEIDLAYRQLSQKYHPSFKGDPESYIKLQELNEAWHVLSDPYQRKQYNLALKKRANVFFPPSMSWSENAGQVPPRPVRQRMQPIDIVPSDYQRRRIPTFVLAVGTLIFLIGAVVGIWWIASYFNHGQFPVTLPSISITTRSALASPTDVPALTETQTETILTLKENSAEESVDNTVDATTVVVQHSCPDGCTAPIADCVIKGDINAFNIRLYYLPLDEGYDSITVNGDLGERWFCTEADALRNGWYHVGTLPPTPSWHGKTATPTPKPTRVPTATRTPKSSTASTPQVIATTALVAPTAARIVAVPTATPTAIATIAAGPTSAFKYSAPQLTLPSNGARYACAKPLTLQWTDANAPLPLAGNEWFVIETKATEREDWTLMSDWTQETSVTLNPLKKKNGCDALWWANTGTYEWRVRIVTGERATHAVTEYLSLPSPSWVISYDH
jgi:hypothetical protein